MLLTVLALLLALPAPTLAHADAPFVAPADDPFAGLYACAPNHGTYVFWLGVRDGDRLFQRVEVLWPEDYPYGTKLRNHGGSAYRVRGGSFSTLSGSVDVEDGALQYDGAACTRVGTLAELVQAFDLDPAELTQEIANTEGDTEAQAMARLDDADFAYAALGYEPDNLDHTFAEIAAGVTLE